MGDNPNFSVFPVTNIESYQLSARDVVAVAVAFQNHGWTAKLGIGVVYLNSDDRNTVSIGDSWTATHELQELLLQHSGEWGTGVGVDFEKGDNWVTLSFKVESIWVLECLDLIEVENTPVADIRALIAKTFGPLREALGPYWIRVSLEAK